MTGYKCVYLSDPDHTDSQDTLSSEKLFMNFKLSVNYILNEV